MVHGHSLLLASLFPTLKKQLRAEFFITPALWRGLGRDDIWALYTQLIGQKYWSHPARNELLVLTRGRLALKLALDMAKYGNVTISRDDILHHVPQSRLPELLSNSRAAYMIKRLDLTPAQRST